MHRTLGRPAHPLRAPLLGAILAAAPLGAQVSQSVSVGHVFLERTYFSPGAPWGEGYLFDGEGAHHVFYHNGVDQGWLGTGEGPRLTFSLSFLPVARMHEGASEPVVTPSFKIRPLLVQALFLKPATRADLEFRMHGVSLGLTHYSNGQDGCFFRGYVRDDATGECLVDDAGVAALESVNERTGDFSSTYIPVRYDFRWGRVDLGTETIVRSHSVGIELQLDTWDTFTGGMSRTLAQHYGRHQVSLWGETERAVTRFGDGFARAGVKATYRPPSQGGADFATVAAEVAYVWERFNYAGLFARVRFGADDYNIRFRQRGPFVHLGFTFDPGVIRNLKLNAATPRD